MSFEIYSTSIFLYHISVCRTRQLFRTQLTKTVCFLLFLTLPAISEAQSQSTDTSLFNTTGAFFALSVKNMEASTKWYSEKLGLKITMQIPKKNKSAVSVLEGGGLIVELIQNDDARPLSTVAPAIKDNILVYGIFKAGAIVNDLDNMIAMFKERGVEIAFGPFPSQPNQRYNVIIRDNSGNLIQFFGK